MANIHAKNGYFNIYSIDIQAKVIFEIKIYYTTLLSISEHHERFLLVVTTNTGTVCCFQIFALQ